MRSATVSAGNGDPPCGLPVLVYAPIQIPAPLYEPGAIFSPLRSNYSHKYDFSHHMNPLFQYFAHPAPASNVVSRRLNAGPAAPGHRASRLRARRQGIRDEAASREGAKGCSRPPSTEVRVLRGSRELEGMGDGTTPREDAKGNL